MSSQVPAPPHLMLPPQTLSGPQNSTSGETHPTTVSKAHPHQATPAPEFTTPTIEIPPSFPIVAKKGSISALGEHSAPTQALAKPNMSQGAPALATQQPGISELPPPWTPPSPRTTRLSLPQPAPKRFSGETCQPPQALIPHKYSLPQELHHRTPIKHIEIAVTPAIPLRQATLITPRHEPNSQSLRITPRHQLPGASHMGLAALSARTPCLFHSISKVQP
eukprot:GHVN01098478.1.p2 GENE.GHVN01098478.1~~GHVN01098478.1.p2  ORF type:complete len:221 (-),score=24.73 GHVN01098478.1:1244-1906(-)